MISKQHIEKTEKQIKELEKLLNPILDDLCIPRKEYNKKWSYAFNRRYNECTTLWVTLDNLKSSINWYKAQGLVDIEVRD
jgi:ferritin-like metal-binding protein YciE